MNQFLKTWALPLSVALCGLVAGLLQLWSIGTVDGKGLLLRGHISQILSWILTAAVLAILFLFTRPMVQGAKYSFNFPASWLGAAGAIAGAVGILSAVFPLLQSSKETLVLIAAWGALAAAGLLVFSGVGRMKGKQFNCLPHCGVCLWFLLLLICQYRQWSAQPQLQLYAFQLLATVFLMVGTFQRACFSADMGQRRSYAFFRLAGIYFCLAAMFGSAFWALYLCAALWSLTDLCSLAPINHKGR